MQQEVQEQAATGSLEPDRAADMGRRAQQGVRKAADRAQRAAEGSQKAERQAVVQYAQDLAMDVQGFLATEVVQKQLQIMSVCFEELCLEVRLHCLAACLQQISRTKQYCRQYLGMMIGCCNSGC